MSKLSDVENVETVEGVEVTRMATRKWRLVTLDQHIGVHYSAAKILRSRSFRDAEIPTVI